LATRTPSRPLAWPDRDSYLVRHRRVARAVALGGWIVGMSNDAMLAVCLILLVSVIMIVAVVMS
jgi:hypothetical protein